MEYWLYIQCLQTLTDQVLVLKISSWLGTPQATIVVPSRQHQFGCHHCSHQNLVRCLAIHEQITYIYCICKSYYFKHFFKFFLFSFVMEFQEMKMKWWWSWTKLFDFPPHYNLSSVLNFSLFIWTMTEGFIVLL